MFAAFFVLAIIFGLVIFGIMLGKRQGVRSDQKNQAESAEPVNPFEGMTYKDEGKALKGVNPFAGVSDFDSDAELWVRARDTFAKVEELIDRSSVLRAEGDVDWRNLSVEAKELCEEALQRGDVWREFLVTEAGEGSTEVKRLDKTLQKWRRTSMILHKTVTR
jgi:hypothetical protein